MERLVQKYSHQDNKWKDIQFKELQKNDIFKLFELVNPFSIEDGYKQIGMFQAKSDAYKKDNNYMIDIKRLWQKP